MRVSASSSCVQVRFPASTAFGIKPISSEGTERLVRSAVQYALDQKRRSLTIVHKGNIMKVSERPPGHWHACTWRQRT